VSFLVRVHFIAQRRSDRGGDSPSTSLPPPSPLRLPSSPRRSFSRTTTSDRNHHIAAIAVAVVVVRCTRYVRVHYRHTDARARARARTCISLGEILLSRARMRRGGRTEEFFRLTDEARSSLLEYHCKVQGIYVPFRAHPRSPRYTCAAACRLHLQLHPPTRTRFVLIYVGEGEGRRAPISIRDLGPITREFNASNVSEYRSRWNSTPSNFILVPDPIPPPSSYPSFSMCGNASRFVKLAETRSAPVTRLPSTFRGGITGHRSAWQDQRGKDPPTAVLLLPPPRPGYSRQSALRRAEERCARASRALATRRRSNFSAAMNKGFPITAHPYLCQRPAYRAAAPLPPLPSLASVPLPYLDGTTELPLCNVINVAGLGTRRVRGHAKTMKKARGRVDGGGGGGWGRRRRKGEGE